jgi:lysosomal acid lipase/cholesteryl ester hydrolase
MERVQILALFLAVSLLHPTICYGLEDYEGNAKGKAKGGKGMCEEVLDGSGYPCLEYLVQTEDGFILGLQRIPHGHDNNLLTLKKQKPPVLLQHGLLVGGDNWFLNPPGQSLGFILADEGFDVWIANVRGTRWSHGHITLTKTDRDYWDWTWDELAMYDLPAMLKFVYKTTGSKVFYVGHSQVSKIIIHPITFFASRRILIICNFSFILKILIRVVVGF